MATTPLTVTRLAGDTAQPTPTPDVITADGVLTLPGTVDLSRLFLTFTNQDAAQAADVSLRAGQNPPAFLAGEPLGFTIDPTTGDYPSVALRPGDAAHYAQADGTLLFDVALHGGAGLTVVCYQLPRW